MARLFALISVAVMSACMLATRAFDAALALIPMFAFDGGASFATGHPRSVFETRRAGLI